MRTRCQPLPAGSMRQSRRQGAVLPWGCPRWVPPTPSSVLPPPAHLPARCRGIWRSSTALTSSQGKGRAPTCDGSGANATQLVQPPHGTRPVPSSPAVPTGVTHAAARGGGRTRHITAAGGVLEVLPLEGLG